MIKFDNIDFLSCMDFLELPDDVNILVPDVCSMKDHERVFDILIKSDVDYIGIDTEWTGSNVLGVISFYVPDKSPYAILLSLIHI